MATDHKADPVQAVKALVESADVTNTEWNEAAIKAILSKGAW